MNQAQVYHQEILNAIRKQASGPARSGDRYIGSDKSFYPMPIGTGRHLIRDWIACHPNLSPDGYHDLLDSLARGESTNEFWKIGELLQFLPALRQALSPKDLGEWLLRAQGWAEVDSICQSKFTAEEMLSRWREWKQVLVAFSKSDNVHQRRASLVLLTRPVRRSADARLSKLAFANIQRLEHEKDILITKAVSWLLRDLTTHHRAEVEQYLRDHADTLPKIAIRETRYKLLGGVKRKV